MKKQVYYKNINIQQSYTPHWEYPLSKRPSVKVRQELKLLQTIDYIVENMNEFPDIINILRHYKYI